MNYLSRPGVAAFILFSHARGKPFFRDSRAQFRAPRRTKMTAGRRPRALVKLYTRPGCHLCEEARREMQAAGCADSYELEEINIDADPELRRRYGWDIPVVTIDGAHAFKHRLTRDAFRDEIRRAVNSRSKP